MAGEVVFRAHIPPSYKNLQDLFSRFPGCMIRVAYEAGACGFALYDQLENDNIRCIVAPPSLIPVESGNRVKTDPRDSLKLSKLLEADMLKEVFCFDRGTKSS